MTRALTPSADLHPYAEAGRVALAQHRAKTLARFHLRAPNGDWLHWSGGMLTINKDHAWEGSETQARKAVTVFRDARDCVLVEA